MDRHSKYVLNTPVKPVKSDLYEHELVLINHGTISIYIGCNYTSLSKIIPEN